MERVGQVKNLGINTKRINEEILAEAFKAVPTFLPWPLCSVLHIPVMVKESKLFPLTVSEGLKPYSFTLHVLYF